MQLSKRCSKRSSSLNVRVRCNRLATSADGGLPSGSGGGGGGGRGGGGGGGGRLGESWGDFGHERGHLELRLSFEMRIMNQVRTCVIITALS